jgi:hypothetical protein
VTGGALWGRRRRPLAAVATLACLVAAALSGCGVPVDGSPTAVARSKVPFGLLEPSRATSPTSTPPPATVTVQIFLLSPTGRLVAVARNVAVPAALPAVLGALVQGPTDAEAAAGLQSALPPGTQVVSATLASGVATVDLAGTFGQLVGQAQIDAVAQIVFTATALTGVTSVAFELDGQQVAVPTASGADVPVANRSAFSALAPLAPPPP